MAARKLRIAVWHNLRSGGAKRALRDQVRGLVRRGHHVEAWCPPPEDDGLFPLSTTVTEHVIPLDTTVPKSTRLLSELGVTTRAASAQSRIERHCRIVAEEIGDRFDVVLATSCRLVGVPPLASVVSPPTVLYLEEPNRRLYEAKPTLPWLDRGARAREAIVAARAELAWIGAFDHVLVNSRFSRESLLRAFGVDADVCYPGVDTEHFHPIASPTREFLLCVGSFARATGSETVVRAIAGAGDAPRLVWVARTVESEAYVDQVCLLARSLGVSVDLRRSVDEGELRALLQHARALVYAPTLESFGYVPLEAAACGTPVVAAAEGGVRELVIDGVHGRLTPPDITALASAIAELWSDVTRANELGASARADVERRWGVESATRRLEDHLFRATSVTAS